MRLYIDVTAPTLGLIRPQRLVRPGAEGQSPFLDLQNRNAGTPARMSSVPYTAFRGFETMELSTTKPAAATKRPGSSGYAGTENGAGVALRLRKANTVVTMSPKKIQSPKTTQSRS